MEINLTNVEIFLSSTAPKFQIILMILIFFLENSLSLSSSVYKQVCLYVGYQTSPLFSVGHCFSQSFFALPSLFLKGNSKGV